MSKVILELSEPCDHYAWDYKTHAYEYFDPAKCPKCRGSNELPNEEGEALLDFLRKHYR
jgi:hypothetical protein